MQGLVLSIILVSGLFFLAQNAFAENLFYGTSSFEKLPTTISDKPSVIELKVRYTEGPYTITKLTPIFEISPESAKEYVQINTKSIDGLYRNDVVRIQNTITVDPQIPNEKIFINVYFNGTDSRGNQYNSAWSDSVALNIEKNGSVDVMQKCKESTLGAKFGKPIDLHYDIEGGTVLDMCKLEDTNSVITKINAESEGRLTITIPKKVVYSLASTDCKDSDLMILLDNEETLPAKSIHTKKDNIITVEFSEGVHTIEFIGFTILPDPSPDQYCGIVMGLDSLYLPPKFQIERGMKSEQVRCNEGLVLVIKATGDSPACVKQETGKKLLERGWIKCTGSSVEGRGHPCGPSGSGVVSFDPPKEIFLSKTVDEWKNISEEQLDPYYQKYKDSFFIELGRFLIKDQMREELAKQGIKNTHGDFRVFSGNMLTSLPPHISYHAIVNATDGNSYLLEGGVYANKIEFFKIDQLSFYSEVLNPPKVGSGRTPPAWKLLSMEPKVTISPQEGNAPLVEPYSLVLDLEKNNVVTFYNNLTVPIRIQQEGSGFVKDEDKLAWKSSIIPPKHSGHVQFNATGYYEWDSRSPPKSSDQWWENQGGGQIAVFSNETQNLPFEEKISIARVFLYDARPDIPWTGMGSSDKGIDITLNDAIFYMIPDAQKYYEVRAKQWIPFDVPIMIESPKTLETPKVLE